MKTLKNRSLKYQFTSVVLILSTLPLLLLSVFSMYFIRQTDIQHKHIRTKEITDTASQILETNIYKHKSSLNEFYLTILEKNYVDFEAHEEEIKTLMYQYLMGDKDKLNLYLINEKGEYVGTSNLPKYYEIPNFRNWGLLRMLNNTNDILFYPNYLEAENSFYKSFSIGKKVNLEEDKILYLILDFSTEYVQNLINSIKVTSDGYVQFVITAENDRIIYNDSSFHSPIYYLDNVFRYERIDRESESDKAVKLDEMIQESSHIEDLDITVYGLIPNVVNSSERITLITGISSLILLTAIISLLIGYALTNTITEPIYELVENIRFYRPFRKLSDQKPKTYENEIQELRHEFDKLIKRIEKYRIEELQQQELLRLSEIKSLMSQINPHFLNNTLDTIKWKAKLNDLEDIADMTSQLSVLLKASMNTEPLVSIREEIRFVNNYALLQQNRYSDRFNFKLEYDENLLDYHIPKLILQPLVENAIIHGVEKSSHSVDVFVSVKKEANYIVFEVKDNGPGFDPTTSFKDESIGLSNIKNRLRLHYEDNASMKISSIINEGTIALIKIKEEELKKEQL